MSLRTKTVALGQTLPKRDVRMMSVDPSISNITVRRPERREGPNFRLYAPQQKPDLFNHLVGALDLLRSP